MSADELPEELLQAGDSPVELALAVDRGLRLWPRLCAEPRLRALELRCDLGGNEEEFAALAGELAARGLPPRLSRLVLDRRRHWSDRWDDTLEFDAASGGLSLAIDEPGDAAPILAALRAMLARAPGLTQLHLGGNAHGRNELDPALELVIAAGPWPELRTLELTCDRSHERDWVQWVACRTLERALAQCPALTKLSLPRAELWVDALAHPELRELELGWLGGAPLGPSNRRDWGPAPTPRGSGLEFLREARLPRLERLAIDFQYDWYVGWQVADLEALCAARGMPRLTHVELRYCELGDELLRRLPTAAWAAGLERLELPGTDFDDETAAALVAARPRLPRLRELWCFRPYELADESWQSLRATYEVLTPA
ncbi:hypothetical protein [Nannocystis punicea]|uniref:Uncharacterized protein n=1 Tax=Nannocystis punicea TaxID=2995304 RepID=A0ABY7GXT0_9BACT|nr:hypothetical protein [Nannocystis poenicansa]WAS91685.1 hypothetical protein O0S08_36350 [Nannocystis poenicansa]